MLARPCLLQIKNLEKEIAISNERREKEVAIVKAEVAIAKAEVDRRVLEFVTSSSYKGIRDLVEKRNEGSV